MDTTAASRPPPLTPTPGGSVGGRALRDEPAARGVQAPSGPIVCHALAVTPHRHRATAPPSRNAAHKPRSCWWLDACGGWAKPGR